MLEIEMKFAVTDFAPIVAKLQQWQARVQPAIQEADHYFNAPDRDFGHTDEAFRLRSIGSENRITYKGPKEGGPTKTRTEIEIGLDPGDKAAEQFRQLVRHLGYRPTAVVKKQRVACDFERAGFAMQACCDNVETLGQFVEIEIVTEPENKQRAQDVLLEVVRELNLPSPEPRAYITMVLERQSAQGAK